MITFLPRGPYDLELSLKIAAAFSPDRLPDSNHELRIATAVDGVAELVTIKQVQMEPPILTATSSPAADDERIRELAAWVVLADVDLTPFYALVSDHPVIGPITRHLHGLKHVRPATLFEMGVIAVTEQQISLAAAYRIRQRIVERFGSRIAGVTLFPGPKELSIPSVEELASCGLSRRKAEYIRDFARKVSDGELDIESVTAIDDETIRILIGQLRGFGRWSADYILVRGLGRVDVVPLGDLGIQTITGRYLGDGHRLSPEEVARVLEPFRPYRGLATFYLLADSRLAHVELVTPHQ
jgi:DNA-3-methyladenine glycosylase II